MTLLYLAVAYLIGIALGRFAWDAGLLTCHVPDWTWALSLVLLPFTAWLNRFESSYSPAQAMRWPARAGFEPPRSRPSPALGIALLLCVVIGLLRYASRPLTPCWTTTDLAYYNLPADRAFDRQAPLITVEGSIGDYPSSKDGRWRLQVTVDRVIAGDPAHQIQGLLLLNTGTRADFRYGQHLRIQGRLAAPADFEDFSYREYLAGRGVHSVMYDPQIEVLDQRISGSWLRRELYALRQRGQALINRLLPEPHAALANGILLGIDSNISDELYDKFNLTGTSHILVISGSNIAILVGALMALCLRTLGRRWGIVATLGAIACYVMLVGADAAVVRAALMGGLVVVAMMLNRSSSALITLAAACWLMTLINPLTLWDVGFQLSTLATAGLILFTVPLTKLLNRMWSGVGGRAIPSSLVQPAAPPGAAKPTSPILWLIVGLLVDGLVVTLAANIMVLPLIAYHFGRISLLGVLANLLIVPVQPLILLCGTLGLITGLLGLSGLAQVLLWIPWLGLSWTLAVVQSVAALPSASLSITPFGALPFALSYACLLALRWPTPIARAMRQLPAQIRQGSMAFVAQPMTIGALAVAACLVWAGVLTLPDGRLHVYFLDVGQGDGILIQTPSGRQVLVDGGPSPQTLAQQLGAVMPFWDRSLDIMLLTHADGDHMNGQIELPERLTVDQVVTTVPVLESEEGRPWRDAMEAAGLSVSEQGQGGWLDLGDGVALWVLWPQQGAPYTGSNEASIVMKVVYGSFSALLTGDASTTVEQAMITGGEPVAATVLKVGHHGSDGSTGPDLVAAANPQMAVIQVGAENRYGHPSQAALDRLTGRAVYRTDVKGRVHLYTDGSLMWVETENGR